MRSWLGHAHLHCKSGADRGATRGTVMAMRTGVSRQRLRYWHAVVLGACTLMACRASPERRDTTSAPAPSRDESAMTGERAASRDSGPVRVEVLDEDATPPTYVVRGEGLGPGRLVFLHGMCGHALGYAQSFQFAAAKRGRLIAPQADVVCGAGPWAKWSRDVKALHERIERAFIELGDEPPHAPSRGVDDGWRTRSARFDEGGREASSRRQHPRRVSHHSGSDARIHGAAPGANDARGARLGVFGARHRSSARAVIARARRR